MNQSSAVTKSLVWFDPLTCPKWDSLLSESPERHFFHTRAWARVLRETYGHRPVYVCRIEQDRILSGLPVMEVSHFLGRRGVSLPFTDFCTPVGAAVGDRTFLYGAVLDEGRRRNWRSFECRDPRQVWPDLRSSTTYWGHTVDLRPGAELLFKALRGGVRRAVSKAERAGVRVEFSEGLHSMRTFYRLHCQTRKRHGVPCQSLRFFDNLARFMLAAGHGFIATAYWGQHPAAAAVFLVQGQQATYKFGASDFRLQEFRPNNLVMWESIKRCCRSGITRLHLGRTSLSQEGLRRFKLGFGAQEEVIAYSRYDFKRAAFVQSADLAQTRLKAVFRHMPSPLLRLVGTLVYPWFA